MATFLLEIGVEELPSSFVDAALSALPDLFKAMLADLRLSHGELQALGTPRRLSILVRDLQEKQADLDEEVVGPPESAAMKDGKPTKAAEAFAAKLGISIDAISIKEFAASGKQKAGKFVVGRRQEKGRNASDLLAAALPGVIAKIPFRKSMRWADKSETFGRPIQWLVALLGSEVVQATYAGVTSGRTTRGHRFLAPAQFEIANADAYVDALRKAHVLVNRKERADTMMKLVGESAKSLGGEYDLEEMLVNENASLVEMPHVVVGSFEAEYLSLPAAVIRSVARGHQRYFCVQKDEDTLLPNYITIVNTALNPASIKKGNDRVMRARLADARFFYEEDKRAKLEDRVEKTSGIVFHNRLGTVREKTERIKLLAVAIAKRIGLAAVDLTRVERAAHLAKSDLVSLMVGEFPELQGHMGRAYAKHAGEDAIVADSIRDHYRPVGASDGLPTEASARIVALSDRLDTLVGCFAVGLSPTGAADPFALRRACIAVLRLVSEGLEGTPTAALRAVGLDELFGLAYDGLSARKLDLSKGDTIAKVLEFSRDRLRGILSGISSTGVADAILGGADVGRFPAYELAKTTVLHEIVEAQAPWLEKAKTVSKRLNGISKDANPVFHAKSVFSEEKDTAIGSVIEAIDNATKSLTTESEVRAALQKAEGVAERVDNIFVTTLVNDPNDAMTPKRLELLSYGAKCMLRIADFSKLSGSTP